MLNKNKKTEIFDSCLESKTDEVDSTSEQFEEPITSQNTNRRLNDTTPDQNNSSGCPRNSSDSSVLTPVSYLFSNKSDDVSVDQLTKRLSVLEGLINNNLNVGRETKKSVDVLYNHLRGVKTKIKKSSEDPGNSPDKPVRISVSVDVSDDRLTKRLNVIEELITQHINVGRDANKSVNDRLGRLEIEVGIIACMLLLVLLVFIVGVLIILL